MSAPDNKTDERPKPRPIQEIFTDLRALTHADGSLHSIGGLVQRDWFLTVDIRDGVLVGEH
jgi:hypothetical protein